MPDRTRKKRPADANRRAWEIVQEATAEEAEEPIAAGAAASADGEDEESEKNPHAVALGRLGGLKGGKARAAKLTPEKRREIAKKAAEARWNKNGESNSS